MATLLLGELTGAAIEPIPYQGSAPQLVDLMAGRLDAAFDNVATSHPHARAGRLRTLGVSGINRAAVAPDVPTLAEAGIDGFIYQSWQGFFAPKRTPDEVTTGLVAALPASVCAMMLARLAESRNTAWPAQGRQRRELSGRRLRSNAGSITGLWPAATSLKQ